LLDKKSRLPVAIKDVVIVVAGVAVVWAIVWIGFGTNPFYVVSSGSMEPVLKQYDILVVRDGQSFDDLKVGEIIVFHRPEGGDRVIVHRIIEILEGRDGDRIIRTKGDANPASIPGTDFPIEREDYIGRVVYVIPGVGFITQAIAPPVNYIIIAIILAILFFNRMGKKSKPVQDATAEKQSPISDGPADQATAGVGSQNPPGDVPATGTDAQQQDAATAQKPDPVNNKPTEQATGGVTTQNTPNDSPAKNADTQQPRGPGRDKNEVQD
jgi:signal peptidase I